MTSLYGVSQSVRQSVSQSVNQSFSQSVSHSVSQSVRHSVNQTISQSDRQSVSHQSVSQSVKLVQEKVSSIAHICGLDNSVGIATVYGTDVPGIESRWGREFPPVQTHPGAHPASCTMGTGSFPGVKCGRGVLLTTHPLLVLRSCKSRAITLPTLWATPCL